MLLPLGGTGNQRRLALSRQFAERDVDGFLLASVHHSQLHRRPGRKAADGARNLAGIADLLAVDGGDDVAGLDTGLDGRSVCLRLRDQRAASLLEAEIFRDVRRDPLVTPSTTWLLVTAYPSAEMKKPDPAFVSGLRGIRGAELLSGSPNWRKKRSNGFSSGDGDAPLPVVPVPASKLHELKSPRA